MTAFLKAVHQLGDFLVAESLINQQAQPFTAIALAPVVSMNHNAHADPIAVPTGFTYRGTILPY